MDANGINQKFLGINKILLSQQQIYVVHWNHYGYPPPTLVEFYLIKKFTFFFLGVISNNSWHYLEVKKPSLLWYFATKYMDEMVQKLESDD